MGTGCSFPGTLARRSVGEHLARQDADVAVLEGPLAAEGDLHCLFVVGSLGGRCSGASLVARGLA